MQANSLYHLKIIVQHLALQQDQIDLSLLDPCHFELFGLTCLRNRYLFLQLNLQLVSAAARSNNIDTKRICKLVGLRISKTSERVLIRTS